MQGEQSKQPELVSTLNLEEFIPRNHLLRRVDKVVDLSFIGEMTRDLYSKDNGRPSIDPELFFRMMIIEYLYGIKSDRQLCEEISYNLAFRWYCRLNMSDRVPDHSSLTRIRDRLGEKTFERIFQKIVELCIERKLVTGRGLMTDGSLVRANVSLDSMRRGDMKDATLEEVRKNSSDPDASIVKNKDKGSHFFYKAHHSIDRDSRVILDPFVTTGALHESTIYTKRIEAIQRNFGIIPAEVVADRGYGTGETLTYLRLKGIRPIIPLYSSRSGNAARQTQAAGFKYDKQQNCYVCQAGKKLTCRSVTGDNYVVYGVARKTCAICPHFQSCLTEHEKKIGRGKSIRRNIFQKLFEWSERREKTHVFKEISRERMWKMEGIWAEAKNFHGFTRAKYRGRSKFEIQAFLTATCQNIKRLVGAFLFDLFNKLMEIGVFRVSNPIFLKIC